MKQVLIGLCGAAIALVIVCLIAAGMAADAKHVPVLTVKPVVVEVPVIVSPVSSSVESEQVRHVTTPRSVD